MNNNTDKMVITFLNREEDEESGSFSNRDTFIIEFYDSKYDKVIEEIENIENYKELKKLVDNKVIISCDGVLSYIIEDERVL